MASVAVSMTNTTLMPDYLVQCPACQTRYAIEAEILATANKPKFHCSHCDHLFDPDWQAITRGFSEPVQAEPESEAFERIPTIERRKIRPTQNLESYSMDSEPTPPHETPLIETPEDEWQSNELKSDQTQVTDDPFQSTISARPRARKNSAISPDQLAFQFGSEPSEHTDASEESFDGRARQMTQQAARRTAEFSQEERTELMSGRFQGKSNVAEAPSEQSDASDTLHHDTFSGEGLDRNNLNGRFTDPFANIRQPDSRQQDHHSDFSANTINIPRQENHYETSQRNAAQAFNESSYANNAVGREYRGMKSAMFFVIPIVLITALLAALSAGLLTSKPTAASFTSLIYPNIPRPAPSGVRIESPTISKVTLDSGEQVLLVSAKVFNGSNQLLKNATIEVAAFNSKEELVSRNRVYLGNSLTKMVIKSLSPEIIRQLQNQTTSRQSSAVSVGKDKEFMIAVNDGKQLQSTDPITAYTVRVSSVTL